MLLLILPSFAIGCSQEKKDLSWNYNNPTQPCISPEEDTTFIQTPIDTFFNRSQISENLLAKKEAGKPLVVHIYVPLCDNENQGIVPTSASLGDGMNLRTNLYWATSGGTKAYFKKRTDWNLISNTVDLDTNVLERVVFQKKIDESMVYVIADAYRGDRMEETVNDFLGAIAGIKKDSIQLGDKTYLGVGGDADLVMFNGHNGIMDYITLNEWDNLTERRVDVVMNSCLSYTYLQDEFMRAGGYPLIRSKTLLYPGAYVLASIIEDWARDADPEKIRINAGKVYCQKHDCGTGKNVYHTGW